MLVLSLAVGLVPLDPERVLALRRVGDVVFKRPVRLNEAISVAGEITALRPIDERSGLVDFGWAIRNQDGDAGARARTSSCCGAGRARPARSGAGPLVRGDHRRGGPGEFIPVPL